MPIWGKTFTYSAKREQDGHRCLWKDLYINILCLILPVAGVLHPTVRGSRTKIQTKPFFTMSISSRHTNDRARNLLKASRANRGVLIMDTVRSGWWRQTGSNRRPEACKATALPTELCPQLEIPPFGCAERRCSNHGGPRRT
jgi:hypothetical protein